MVFIPTLTETDFGTKKKARKAIKRIERGKGKKFHQAMKEYVEAVLADARLMCPVGTPMSTGIPNYVGGSLKGSIRLITREVAKGGEFVAGRDITEEYMIVAGGAPFINPNTNRFVDYAQAVHDGTSKMAPRPFLTDALAKNKQKFDMIIDRYMKSAYEEEWVKDQCLRGDTNGKESVIYGFSSYDISYGSWCRPDR